MKQLFYSSLLLLFIACQFYTDRNALSSNGDASLQANPCIKCTEKLQLELASCYKSAGDDSDKRQECDKVYAEKWTEECGPLCK
jgi:hypothetical protein